MPWCHLCIKGQGTNAQVLVVAEKQSQHRKYDTQKRTGRALKNSLRSFSFTRLAFKKTTDGIYTATDNLAEKVDTLADNRRDVLVTRHLFLDDLTFTKRTCRKVR